MEQTITIPSRRYYLTELLADPANTPETIRSLADTFMRFNVMVEWTYNRLYDERVLGIELPETLTAMITKESAARFGKPVDSYTVTSIYSRASALLSSQKELQKQYNEDHAERQDNRREKVQSLQDDLAKKQAIKNLLAARARATKVGIPFDDDAFAEYKISVSDDGVLFRGAKNRMVKLNLYLYECRIDGQICSLKTRIAQINDKIRRADLTHKTTPVRATFGTKKQYRLKDTVCTTKSELAEWHHERNLRRCHNVYFSGRHTSKEGNFQCKYDIETNTVTITLIDGKVLTLSNMEFPYRGDELLARRKDPAHPSIGYSLEYRKDSRNREYFILKASFAVENNYLNCYRMGGVVGYDLNYDHIAWAELDGQGHCLHCGVIPFSIEGKSSGETKVILATAMKQLIDISLQCGKPLAGEDLGINKNHLEYGNKKANRHISGFAYTQMDDYLHGQALRNSVHIIKVNPAYTSFLGKIKYMRPMGISIHCAAAIVIGRRGMGFHERLPKPFRKIIYRVKKDGSIPTRNKTPNAAYRLSYNHAKSIPIAFWYRKGLTFKTWKSLDQLADQYKAALKGNAAATCKQA